MKPLTNADFPITAQGYNVYRRTESGPICTCSHMDMAAEIAKRLNEGGPPICDDTNNHAAMRATSLFTAESGIGTYSMTGRSMESPILIAALREIAAGPPEGMTKDRWIEQVRMLALECFPPPERE